MYSNFHDLKNRNLASSHSLLGVKGGKLKAYQGCDMRNGVLGNPDCGSGERCVAVIGNAGTCHPGNICLTTVII